MEPEGSLPHSQVHVTCPYPEPARSSPCPHQLPLHEDHGRASNDKNDLRIVWLGAKPIRACYEMVFNCSWVSVWWQWSADLCRK